VIRTTVLDSKSAGIFVKGGQHFAIFNNFVANTKADGIHATDRAYDGRIFDNRVFNSGDDGIAVVSYWANRKASGIAIVGNTVKDIRWGRGISVIGSSGVRIANNRVHSVAMAAGIIVAREAFFHTPSAHDVEIVGNYVSNIQNGLTPLKADSLTGQGAIDLNSDSLEPNLAVSRVLIQDNIIDGSQYDGIRMLGNVCGITISNNSFRNVRGRAIAKVFDCAARGAIGRNQ
jgi:Right handed beta helix region